MNAATNTIAQQLDASGYRSAFNDLESPISTLNMSARMLCYLADHLLTQLDDRAGIMLDAYTAEILNHAAGLVFNQASALDEQWTSAHNARVVETGAGR